MRSLRALLAFLLVSAGLPLAPVASPATLHPIPATLLGTVGEIAYQALVAKLGQGALFIEKEDSGLLFVKDQMIGVLLLLSRAQRLPPEAAGERAALLERARAVWTASEAAYAPNEGYYSVTVITRSVCADFAANAWALRAAGALARQFDEPQYDQRAKELAATFVDLLRSDTHQGIPTCPAGTHGIHQSPLALLALLEELDRRPNAPLQSSIRQELEHVRDENFTFAYHDPLGFYAVPTNAQMLVVLHLAADLLPGVDFAPERAAVAEFMLQRLLVRFDDQPWAVGVSKDENGTFAILGQPDVVNQWWALWALHNHLVRYPNEVPSGILGELTTAARARFWAQERQGFVSEEARVYFEANALPALFFTGPVLTRIAPNLPELRVIVPQRADFDFPSPSAPDADQFLLRNRWEVQFTVAADAAGVYRLVLPTGDLAELNATFPPTPYTPSTVLQLGLQRVPHTLLGDPYPVLEVPAVPLAVGQNTFRLSAYAPILPSAANMTDTIRLVLHNHARKPLQVGQVYLEVEASQIELLSTSLNAVSLPSQTILVEGPLTTKQLPEPHLGIQLTDLVLLPRSDNELLLQVKDVTGPVVQDVTLTRDEAGTDPRVPKRENIYEITTQDANWLRATVRDNLGVRQVYLTASTQGLRANSTQIRMLPTASDPHVFAAALPRFGQSGTVDIRVVALDFQGNRVPQEPSLLLAVENPLFQGGSVILFVFSLTLLLAGLVIYVKMGRKP